MSEHMLDAFGLRTHEERDTEQHIGGQLAPNEHQTVRQQPVQQELFSDAEVAEEVKDTLERGAGIELWQRLLAEYDGPAKTTLHEVKYLGLDGGVFCVVATDEQKEIINTKGDGDLYREARLILGMSETSFRPPIVFRKM